MTARISTFRNRRYNAYVPAAQYASNVVHSAPYNVDFGTPAAASAAAILSAQSVATAGSTTTFISDNDTTDIFGRNVTVVASGAATSNVTVFGRDYLGQPMAESLTLNGATPVVGVKAFQWIDRVTFGATSATTINLGWGARLGLPYRMSNVVSETAAGASAATGTFTAGSLTDPQVNTTADPRGLYTPTTALNGTNRILAFFIPNGLLNTSGNGGLYGIAHAAS